MPGAIWAIPPANQGRTELIRWDSPTYQGFILSASIGEAGDYWGTMLRYANEFNGVRVAAGIGYENATDTQTAVGCVGIANFPAVAPQSTSCVNPPGAGPANLNDPALNGEVKAWGAGLSLLHVPSGLFVQGHYMAAEFEGTGSTAYWGQVANVGVVGGQKSDADQWLIQAGITKNWFGFGNTALYAEYSRNSDWGAGNGIGRSYSVATIPGAVAVNGVTDTEMDVWGIGVVQNLDAAATEMYLAWRHFDTDVTCNGAVSGTGVCAGAAGGPSQEAQYRGLRRHHRRRPREVLNRGQR